MAAVRKTRVLTGTEFQVAGVRTSPRTGSAMTAPMMSVTKPMLRPVIEPVSQSAMATTSQKMVRFSLVETGPRASWRARTSSKSISISFSGLKRKRPRRSVAMVATSMGTDM